MKVPTKFIQTLSDEEHSKLLENHQSGATYRLRNRSHAILLSFAKYPRAEMAKLCRVDRDTVSLWIDHWNEAGSHGLADEERSGRPPILTVEEQAQAIASARKKPKFPPRQLSEIKREVGKTISKFTLKDRLKKKTSFGKESS